MANVLLIDVGSTFTKVTAVDIDSAEIIGTSRSFTTIDSDINIGLKNAIKLLEDKVGKREYSNKYCSSSAAGGLKMIAIGLVPELTVQAAKLATENAGAKLIKTFSYKLSKSEVSQIIKAKPDIVLLCGGTDGGNSEVILHNANMLAKATSKLVVVVAGNKSVSDEAGEILELAGHSVTVCDNVMPTLETINIVKAQEAIRNIFLSRIIRAKGMTKVESLIDGILMPTPSAVFKAAKLLSEGTKKTKGLGELVLVDIGGATTDVYSICQAVQSNSSVIYKGIKQPYCKRSVEGDLGARYSCESVVEAVGKDEFAEQSQLSVEQIDGILNKIHSDYSVIANDDNEISFDLNIARSCVSIALARHAGQIELSYTPMGSVYVQTGKDLRSVSKVIGTGGPIIDCSDRKYVLSGSLGKPSDNILKPHKAEFGVDEKYILAAMGLLSEYNPEVALQIMLKEIKWSV